MTDVRAAAERLRTFVRDYDEYFADNVRKEYAAQVRDDVALLIAEHPCPDNDIAAGRVESFDSMDALIDNLHQPQPSQEPELTDDWDGWDDDKLAVALYQSVNMTPGQAVCCAMIARLELEREGWKQPDQSCGVGCEGTQSAPAEPQGTAAAQPQPTSELPDGLLAESIEQATRGETTLMGLLLKYSRLFAGFGLREFAERCGVSPSNYYEAEHGSYDLTEDEAERVLNTLEAARKSRLTPAAEVEYLSVTALAAKHPNLHEYISQIETELTTLRQRAEAAERRAVKYVIAAECIVKGTDSGCMASTDEKEPSVGRGVRLLREALAGEKA